MADTITHGHVADEYETLPDKRLAKADKYRRVIKRQTRTMSLDALDDSSFDLVMQPKERADSSTRDDVGSDPIQRNRIEESQLTESFQVLQAWHGVVTEIFGTYFVARILAKGSVIEEEAQIPVDEISPRDRNSIEVGSSFYWTIGYRQSRSGQTSRQSLILFSRRPNRTRKMSADSEERARKVSAAWLSC